MSQKLESLVQAMDGFAQIERDCSLEVVARRAPNQVDVLVSFDEFDEEDWGSFQFVLVDVGSIRLGDLLDLRDVEAVEVWVGGVRVLVSAIPAAVLAVVLGL
jgi:hypothetical protein